jgi:hypothetical protein
MSNHDLVYRLRKRAEIRRQIPDRKSVQEGQPDRIADLLEEAADVLEKLDKHEPVAWREVAGKTTQYYDYNEDGRGEPLYLHREWVGLTDEEILARDPSEECWNLLEVARGIEAKLKEKNT